MNFAGLANHEHVQRTVVANRTRAARHIPGRGSNGALNQIDQFLRVIARDMPGALLRRVWPRVVLAQLRIAAESLCYQWAQTERLDAVLTRSFNHVGPGQDVRFAVASFAQQVARIVNGTRPPRILTGNLDVTRDLTDGGRLLEIAPLERLSKKVDTLENRVRYATYGYAGFFDAVQIKEQQLDAIYQFDLRLVEKVEAIEASAAALRAKSGTPTELKSATAALEQTIDDLGNTFDTRHQAINGFGEATAPGRPLFQ